MSREENIGDIIKEVLKFSRRGLLEAIANVASSLDNLPGRMRIVDWPRQRLGLALRPQEIALPKTMVITHSGMVSTLI